MENYKIYIKLFILIPLILIFFIIRIFKNFNINRIISHKIGHMTTPMEIYICESKSDLKKIPTVWFFDKKIANLFLKKKLSQKLFILPRQILEPIYILFNKFKFFKFFLVDFSKETDEVKKAIYKGIKHIDNKDVLLKYKPSIQFNDEEEAKGQHYLKKIGVQNEKFFGFVSRTSEFHNEKFETTRNSDINDKIQGVKFLISKGYKAIRMGKYETKKINWNELNIIDYATSNDRCDFLDIYLTSKCKFLLSDSTGNTSVLNLFRKHCLTVNECSIHTLEHHPEKLMILIKKFKNLHTNKIVSFEEAYKKKLNYIGSPNELKELGYEIIDNNEIEIKEATESYYDLINNNLNLNEIYQKQKNYWQNVEKYIGDRNKYKTIICPNFYSKNKNLFE